MRTIRERVDAVDWSSVLAGLDDVGAAPTGAVLGARECTELARGFDDDVRYRATIDMARHRFGEGTYRYFAYPHPPLVAELRRALWPHLLPIARRPRDTSP